MKARLQSRRIVSSIKADHSGDSKYGLRLRGGSGGYDVFVSFVAAEAADEAAELQSALEKYGNRTFVAPDTAQKEEMEELIDALDGSKVVVILGTSSYGSGGTKAHLTFIEQESKPCVVVMLTDRFKVAMTRYTLKDARVEPWKPGTSVPANVVDRIGRTLQKSKDKTKIPTDGFAEYIYSNGVKYVGLWKDGQPDGLGRQEYADGSTYEGSFRAGYRQGLGRYTFGPNSPAPGDYYDGSFLRGQRDGQGKYVYSLTGPHPGDVYIGGWRKGKRQGYGTYRYASGDIFNGQWVKGKKQGQGMYTYGGENKGDVYMGEYHNDVREGNGEYSYKNGDFYKGGWARNDKNGHGVFVFGTSGNRYDGEWKDGHMEGYGELFWGPGSGFHGASFKGQWKQGKRDGKGVFVAVTGEEQEGTWVNGKLIK